MNLQKSKSKQYDELNKLRVVKKIILPETWFDTPKNSVFVCTNWGQHDAWNIRQSNWQLEHFWCVHFNKTNNECFKTAWLECIAHEQWITVEKIKQADIII